MSVNTSILYKNQDMSSYCTPFRVHLLHKSRAQFIYMYLVDSCIYQTTCSMTFHVPNTCGRGTVPPHTLGILCGTASHLNSDKQTHAHHLEQTLKCTYSQNCYSHASGRLVLLGRVFCCCFRSVIFDRHGAL